MKTVAINGEKSYIEAFLKLPQMLYKKSERTNSKSEELQLINGTHILSHYFSVKAFLVLDEYEKPIARCIVTLYPNDSCGYLGLFEAKNDETACEKLFDAAHLHCVQNKIYKVLGPVDASIWIKYRLKYSGFAQPFTGEPHNKPYYKTLFEKFGYTVHKKYISNVYAEIENYTNKKGKKRLLSKLAQGYEIISPSKRNFQKHLREVYCLLLNLYSDFPAFKPIGEDEFVALFYNLRHIADYSMIKLAYLNGELTGFFIAFPNYGKVLCGNLTPLKFLQLQWLKKHAKQYIAPYLGVKKGHEGLGVAITELVLEHKSKRKIRLIGALIQEGKATNAYFGDKLQRKIEYALMYKNLKAEK